MKEVKVIARAIGTCLRPTLAPISLSQQQTTPAGMVPIKALTTLDHRSITEMCSDTENLVFPSREWAQLTDLCALLEPFSEATDLTEGDTAVTIRMVVPTILDLRRHLIKMEVYLPQIVTIVRAMKKSLEKRFSGIFRKINMEEGDPEQPFNH